MNIVIFIILGLYMMLCYYIGVKGKKIVFNNNVKLKHKAYYLVYWLIYWIIALAFILSNMLRGLSVKESWLTSTITLIGAIYLGIFIYSILIFSIVDILRLILKKINISHSAKKTLKKIYFSGISIFIIVFILVGFGIWTAQNKVITNYEVNIDKDAGEITSLNVVMVSDVHMGIEINENGVNEMVNSINKLNPDIVLNHRPEGLVEAETEGVDLQLSGHTHNGQIFPGNLVTNYLNEKSYGYLKKDNFNLIVSSGYGTWGPPMRIGTISEMVNIKINFHKR